MKYITIIFTTLVFLFGAVGCVSADITGPQMPTDSMERSLLSAHDHMSQAQNLEQKIDRLAKKVIDMDQKVATYNKKPYLDTKGIRRNGLKLLIGSTLDQIKTLRKQVAWHRAEASRLAEREKAPEEMDFRAEQSSAHTSDTAQSNSSTQSQSS